MKILIADDDGAGRSVLERTLKNAGHDVIAVENGLAALRVFESQYVPLVISDLSMPGLDGLGLCQRIRAAARPQYTYFILLTVAEGKSAYLAGMNAGADDFIPKPFDLEMLAARITVADRILKLQSQVKQLVGLLPICSVCKRVRDDHNYWHQVESYVAKHSDATFTHSYCPDCFRKLLSDVEGISAAIEANKS